MFHHPEDGFRRSIHSLENGYFRSKFEDDLPRFRGSRGLGIISDTDPQPILFNSHLGSFAIATVSRLANLEELEQHFLDKKRHFTENFEGNVNPTEVVANLICEEENYLEGIENVFHHVKGSCSMVILTEDRIIAARDKLGRTPVIIGRSEHGFAVASETMSFPNTGYETEYFLGPGEVVEITEDGYHSLRKAGEKMQICAFLWVYYGFPTSFYEDVNVDEVRYRCGETLARKDKVEADFVCGIPDSGVGHAIGYGNANGLPYMRAYSKYTPTWPRSFMPQHQDVRDLVARMKLIPNKRIIDGKRIVFCDDSIVRGTQLKETTMELRGCGAREVHMRIACPPLAFPCTFLNFSQSRSTRELATRKAIIQLEGAERDLESYSDPKTGKYRAMVEQIEKNLGIDSLMYQELDDLVEAIGLPGERLCTHCWDGTGYFD